MHIIVAYTPNQNPLINLNYSKSEADEIRKSPRAPSYRENKLMFVSHRKSQEPLRFSLDPIK